MKAKDIQVGDELVSSGRLVYTVTEVTNAPIGIIATVRYRDGGPGQRIWAPDTEVPLVHAE